MEEPLTGRHPYVCGLMMVLTYISTGSQMLKNLGWKKGEGLGKDGSGIKEPVR